MISVPLAVRLRDAGLRWDPTRGDQFVILDRGMDGEVFVLSDMTVEVHDFPGGPVIGFNGTVEWALDSVDQASTLWLPDERQLRERLGGTFVALRHADGRFTVDLVVAGNGTSCSADDAAEAYGLALLFLVTGEVTGEVGGKVGGKVRGDVGGDVASSA